jgi:hypothetical protein
MGEMEKIELLMIHVLFTGTVAQNQKERRGLPEWKLCSDDVMGLM